MREPLGLSGKVPEDTSMLIDCFVLKGSGPVKVHTKLSIDQHPAGPRLVYRDKGEEFIIAAWLLDEVWITRLWVNRDVKSPMFDTFYRMGQIHKALQNRLSKLKVDWCWFGDMMTDQALNEKLLVKVTKGIT